MVGTVSWWWLLIEVTGGVESSSRSRVGSSKLWGGELGAASGIISQVCYREFVRIGQIITVGPAVFVFKRYFYAMF